MKFRSTSFERVHDAYLALPVHESFVELIGVCSTSMSKNSTSDNRKIVIAIGTASTALTVILNASRRPPRPGCKPQNF